VIDDVSGPIGDVFGQASELLENGGSFLNVIGEAAVNIGGQALGDFGSAVVGAAESELGINVGEITENLTGLFGSVSGGVGGLLGEIGDAGAEALGGLLEDVGIPTDILESTGGLIENVFTQLEDFDVSSLAELGQQFLGDEFTGAIDSIDSFVSSIGSGDLGGVISTLTGDGRFDDFVTGITEGAGDFIGKLVDGGAVGDFLSNVGSGGLTNVLNQLGEGGIGDFISNLDSEQTVNLINTLIGQGSEAIQDGVATAGEVLQDGVRFAGDGIDEAFDIVGGALTDVEETLGDLDELDLRQGVDTLVDDVTGTLTDGIETIGDGIKDTFGTGGADSDAPEFISLDPIEFEGSTPPADVADGGEDIIFETQVEAPVQEFGELAPAPEPEPTEFDTAVEAADSAGESADALFEDL
jgi:hypothetical protein